MNRLLFIEVLQKKSWYRGKLSDTFTQKETNEKKNKQTKTKQGQFSPL